ncbi:UNVERIFIED_CONTAM: hypothetical protein ABID98_003601 [Brevibacillus sp. OAP136]
MRRLTALGNLEASYFRPWMLGNAHTRYWQIAGFLTVLIMGSLLLFHDSEQMGMFLIRGVGFTWLGLFYLVIVRVTFSIQGGQLEWWLTLSYPRFSLVAGKAIGLLYVGMHFILYTLAVMIAHCLIASGAGWMQPFALQDLAQAASLHLLYGFAGLPCAVSFGILSLACQVGFSRIWLALLFFAASMMTTSWMFLSFIHDPYEIYASMALRIMLIGWPLSLFVLWLVASVGLKRLGNAAYAGAGVSSWQTETGGPRAGRGVFSRKYATSSSSLQTTTPTAPLPKSAGQKMAGKRRHPFWSLVSLERTRYRCIGFRASFRAKCVAYPLMLILFIAGYWSGGTFESILLLWEMLLMALYTSVSMYGLTGLHADMHKGQAEWWLAFPHSRLTLLGSRLYAYFTSMFSYFCLALLIAGTGVLIRILHSPLPAENWSLLGGHVFYSVVPTLLAVIVTVSLFQIMPLTYKDSRMHLVVLPIYLSYYFGIRYLRDWFYPDFPDERTGLLPPHDYWSHLSLLTGIGLPLGAVCIFLGAKYLNHFVNASRTSWGKRP